MSVETISPQINVLEALRARQALFKQKQNEINPNALNVSQKAEQEKEINPEAKNSEKVIFGVENSKIEELKKIAEKYNKSDIGEEDIKYALKYGTSLFANALA